MGRIPKAPRRNLKEQATRNGWGWPSALREAATRLHQPLNSAPSHFPIDRARPDHLAKVRYRAGKDKRPMMKQPRIQRQRMQRQRMPPLTIDLATGNRPGHRRQTWPQILNPRPLDRLQQSPTGLNGTLCRAISRNRRSPSPTAIASHTTRTRGTWF